MPVMDAERSLLLVVDFQARLMPAIHEGAVAIANARRLLDAARFIGVETIFTEQYPKGLGATIPDLETGDSQVVSKVTFDASRTAGFLDSLPADRAVIVTGCEAHVCVLQTVLGILSTERRVFVVADAIGSRREENKQAAIRRMEKHGAEIVTTEMVIFEWLGTAEHPRFREIMALIK